MSINLDRAIAAGDLEIQTRITRYDVYWGVPITALTIKKLSLAYAPAIYYPFRNEAGLFPNIGYLGSDYDLDYNAGSLGDFAPIPVDPTDTYWGNNPNTIALNEIDVEEEFIAGFTVSCWFNMASLPTHTSFGVVTDQYLNGNAGTGTFSIWVEMISGVPYTRLSVFDTMFTDTSTPLTIDTWYYVTAKIEPTGAWLTGVTRPARSWDTAKVTLYVNGVQSLTSNITGFSPSRCQPLLVGNLNFNGSPSPIWDFRGAIDELVIYAGALSDQVIQKIHRVGRNLGYLEPEEEEFDTDVNTTVLVPENYKTTITGDGATHYWTMDKRDPVSGQIIVKDETTLGIDEGGDTFAVPLSPLYLKSSSATDSNWYKIPGAVNALNGQNKAAISFAGKGQQGFASDGITYVKPDHTVATPGSYGEFSVEFWYKPTGTSRDVDGIVGYPNYRRGFVIAQHADNFLEAYLQWDSGSDFFKSNQELTLNVWHHIVFTVDVSGTGTLYINGVIDSSKKFGKAFQYPNTTDTNFCIGSNNYGGNFDDVPRFWADELALYATCLSAQQVANHYLVGINGPYTRFQISNEGTDTTTVTPYALSNDPLPSIQNGEDITQYVADFNIDDDIKQFVSTGYLEVYESWGLNFLRQKLSANNYVTIEDRYISQSTGLYSEWQNVGHFLVEGPVAVSTTAEGRRVFQVALRSLLKLATLDTAHSPIEPDKIFVPKQAMTYREATSDYTKFKLPNPSLPGTFYENWAEAPNARLWVTNLQNVGDGDQGGINDPGDEIRIKGSEGSVQVLGGEGAIVIDNNYLTDSFSNNGLGNPQTVLAEFYRYATAPDVQMTTVHSIDFSKISWRWQVGFEFTEQLVNGKTVFVKTGKAKGKWFKLTQPMFSGSDTPSTSLALNTSGRVHSVTRSGGTGTWTFGNCNNGYGNSGTLIGVGAILHPANGSTKQNFLRVNDFTSNGLASVPNDAVLTGIRIRFNRAVSYPLNAKVTFDAINITLAPGKVAAMSITDQNTWTSAWTETSYGGYGRLFGVSSATTAGDLKPYLPSIDLGITLTNALTGNYVGSYMFIRDVTLELIFDFSNTVVFLSDLNGYAVDPNYEGIEVGDQVQIGDFNRIEDAYRKVLLRNGFQETDPDRPFYFELEPCPAALLPATNPIRPSIFDGNTWLDILTAIRDVAPPNYRLYTDADGVTRGQLVGLGIGNNPSHVIDSPLDMSEDHSDYGIATRIIAQGQSPNSYNAALCIDAGGQASVRSYVLSGYADYNTSYTTGFGGFNLGRTVLQDEADSIWKQVFNGNPKTPIPACTTEDSKNYGVILAQYGLIKDVKRWTYEDTVLCALDLGQGGGGRPIEIDTIEMTWFNHFIEGNTIKQTMYVDYMTEDDYATVYGFFPQAKPSQTDTAYFPPATSNMWRPLVDEFALDEGAISITAGDFVTGGPTKVRFLRIRVGQGHYRFPYDKDDTSKRAACRVTLAECKVFTSPRILATAELGVTTPFDSGAHKALAFRLRRRTDIKDLNLYLDTYARTKDYARSELQERFVDFKPLSTTVLCPTLEAGHVVLYRHPELGTVKTYLVIARSRGKSGQVKAQLLNYDLDF